MPTIRGACPKCEKNVLVQAPENTQEFGRISVTCHLCGVKSGLEAFRDNFRQQKVAGRREATRRDFWLGFAKAETADHSKTTEESKPINADAGKAQPSAEDSLVRIEAVLKDVRQRLNYSKTRLTQIYFALIPVAIVAYIALAAVAIWLLFQLPALLRSTARY